MNYLDSFKIENEFLDEELHPDYRLGIAGTKGDVMDGGRRDRITL